MEFSPVAITLIAFIAGVLLVAVICVADRILARVLGHVMVHASPLGGSPREPAA